MASKIEKPVILLSKTNTKKKTQNCTYVVPRRQKIGMSQGKEINSARLFFETSSMLESKILSCYHHELGH